MAPRYCAWGGCDIEVGRDAKYCVTHGARVAARLTPTDEHDLFTQPATPPTRASLPEALAEPIAGKAITSKRAAEGARAGYKSRKLLIHEHIIGEGARGATRPEIAAALGIGVNSVNSACNTLYRQGYIGSNPGHERADPTTGVMCSVLVDEAHVERWRGKPRRERSVFDDYRFAVGDGECDLVDPMTGESMTETQLAKLKAERTLDALDDAEQRSESSEPGNPSEYGGGA